MTPVIYVYNLDLKTLVLPKRDAILSIVKTLSICTIEDVFQNAFQVAYYDSNGKKHTESLDKQYNNAVQLNPVVFTQDITSTKTAIAPVKILQYYSALEEDAEEIFEELVKSVTTYLDNLIDSYNEAVSMSNTVPINSGSHVNVNNFSKKQLQHLRKFRELCNKNVPTAYILNTSTPPSP